MTKAITDRPLEKTGRKATKPPADAAIKVRDLAADGWSVIGIAFKLGIDRKTFEGWLERDTELKDAMALGREQEHHVLYNMLLRAAVEKGNITAALAILNARHGWRTDQSDQGARVNVTIALPGAMTLQQFTAMSAGGKNE